LLFSPNVPHILEFGRERLRYRHPATGQLDTTTRPTTTTNALSSSLLDSDN
jgi:hypothetical protein